MNNMPGFTAAASLYPTSGNYRTTLAFASVGGTVQLAQGNCFSDCMDACLGGPLTTAQCSESCHRRCSGAPPPKSWCTVNDNRQCLPWPLDFICWGSCTRTCCTTEGDQVLCGISPC